MQDKTIVKRVALLRNVTPFSSLTDQQIATLIDDFRLKKYGQGELILRQGERSREIYVVLQGKVRIYKISPAGYETSVNLLSPHDVLGEIAALDNQPHSAFVQAIDPVELLAMPHERFLHHLRSMPDLALNVSRLLCQRLRWATDYAESVVQFDAAGRLLHTLLVYAERFYGPELEPGKPYVLELGLTQADLASLVGTRREWLNRILNDWRKRGLLEYERGVVTILDLARVQAERDSRIEADRGDSDW